MCTTKAASCWQAAAAPISPPRLRHRKHDAIPLMVEFSNLGDLIRRDLDLDKIAIVDLSGERPREFTFRQIDAMAQGVARALLKRGIARGERVAVLSANCAEYLAAVYGIMRAGLIAVPVNFKFPRETIHFIIKDSGAEFVFCDAA